VRGLKQTIDVVTIPSTTRTTQRPLHSVFAHGRRELLAFLRGTVDFGERFARV
jgi:hypothetical protein